MRPFHALRDALQPRSHDLQICVNIHHTILFHGVLFGNKLFRRFHGAVYPFAHRLKCRLRCSPVLSRVSCRCTLACAISMSVQLSVAALGHPVSILFSCSCLQLLWSTPLQPYHRRCPGTYLILLVDLHVASGDPMPAPSSAVDEEDHSPVPTEEMHPYLFTRETRSKLTRDKVAPDYAAVLTVCSRYLWVTPIQLHAEVAQLEYEMAEVEASASSN